MSSIEKLSILGIRSFSPEEQSIIEFYTPLTIIVGHNGAGKTTIIECLKYATTGDLPPNSKGGAFIHDLKLTNESEIKAQIRLKFSSVCRQPMTITRSIQVTQKKSKLEQKTLESLLATKDPATGEQISMSSRVSDLDNEVPRQLGVSKAILDNVLFCHQEESNWPLSEPSALKKKFDEIFSSTRYSKALDQLKSIRKDQMTEVKIQNSNLSSSKVRLDLAKGIELERQVSNQKILDCEQRVVEIDTELELLQNRLDLNNAKKNEFERQKLEFDKILKEKDLNLNTICELTNSIKLMNNSDEELSNMLKQRSSITKDSEEKWHMLKMERDSLIQEISECQHKITTFVSQKEIFNITMDNVRRKQAAFADIAQQLCKYFDLEWNQLETQPMQSSLQVFEEKLQVKLGQLSAIKESKSSIEFAFFSRQQALISRHSKLQNDLSSFTSTIHENEEELHCIESRIADLNCIDGLEKLNRLKEEEISLQNQLSEKQQCTPEAFFSDTKKMLENEIIVLDSNIQNLHQKIKQENNSLHWKNKLNFYLDELNKKKQQQSLILENSHTDIKSLLGHVPQASLIESEIDKYHIDMENKLHSMNQKFEHMKYSNKSLQEKVEAIQSDMQKKQSELHDFERRIAKITNNEDFLMCIEYQEQQLEAVNESLAKFNSELLSEFNTKSNACPLCERSFKDTVESSVLTDKLKSYKQQEQKVHERKVKIRQKLDELNILRPVHDDAERYRLYEIPQLKTSLDTIKQEQEQTQEILNDLFIQVTLLNEKDRLVRKIKKSFESLPKFDVEIQHYQQEILNIKRSYQLENDASINLDENEEPLESLNSQMDAHNKRLCELRTKLNNLNQEEMSNVKLISELKTSISTTKELIVQQQKVLSLYYELQSKKETIHEATSLLTSKIVPLQDEIDRLNDDISQIEQEKRHALREIIEQEQQIHHQLISCQSKLSEISAISQELSQKSQNYAEEILKLEGTIENERQLLKDKSKSVEFLTEKINLSSLELSEIESFERSIKDNLRLRECKQRDVLLASQIDSMKMYLAAGKEQEFTISLRTLQVKISDHLGERSGLLGQVKVLQDHLAALDGKLSGEFLGAEQRYQSDFIKFTTLCLACSDLEKYAKIFDTAIMKYHSMKMEEINRIIRELWQSTYQCSDIDTVEIRSDAESCSGNRTYNYRVVMLKGDKELDMRGRSSAGQRVLTCLIIRLALAEAFGLNCGILALDEPTTNLDRNNIESLADSLVGIIKSRRTQRNFQLIIITHDEEFVEMLGRAECVDWYWRIRKNSKNYSVIERQSYQFNQ